jgi:amino acid permease
MYYQIAAYDLQSSCEPQHGKITTNSIFASLATTAFLFGGHGLFPEEIGELREPESFFNALHITYVILVVMYISNAYVAYQVWGDWIGGDIQFNYPENAATLTSAFLSIVWGLVEITISHVMMLGNLDQILGLSRRLRICGLPACVVRVVFRSGVVCTEVFFAVMLSAAGIANIQVAVGAFGFTALTYYAPYALYWKLVMRPRGDALWLQLLSAVVVLSGVALTITGVYAGVKGIVNDIDTYELFDTSCAVGGTLDLASCENPCRKAYGYGNKTCPL